MSFLDTLQQNTNRVATTENGAVTNATSLDPVLDFFSLAGAMRGREDEAYTLFKKAFSKDKTAAMRCLFYLRDIRGGQGERSVFRYIINKLDEDTLNLVYRFIPEYGRWDEVPINDETINLIKEQLEADEQAMLDGNPVSLLAKWLPSENTSSKETRAKAAKVTKLLGWKPVQYRKKVVALRAYIKLLEQQMSKKAWAEIQYDKIPSQAHRKHIKAFKRHDEARYEKFIEKVITGEKKVNSDTLFTYEVFDTVASDERAAEAMWKSLPDYTNGQNALVVADVSGSMYGRPMSISVSLALYFAEKNEGPFKNFFMTFSAQPQLVEVVGDTLADKLQNIENAHWDMNTDVEAAFRAILDAAKASKANADEMPKILYIISDMEFDSCTRNNQQTNFDNAKEMFAEAGYTLPHVVFWNVNARNNQAPATKFDNCVTLISGSSQSTFQHVLAGKTPVDSMMDILNSERYERIKL